MYSYCVTCGHLTDDMNNFTSLYLFKCIFNYILKSLASELASCTRPQVSENR